MKGKVFYINPQSMINLAKYDYQLLSGMGMPVYYFCSKYYDAAYHPNIIYKKLFSYNKMSRNWQKAISYVSSWFRILLHVVIERPRVVHIQWFRIPRFDYFMVRLLQTLFHIRVVFTAHNLLPHQGNENKSTAVFRKAYHAFDRIIVHSQVTKSEIINTFRVNGDKIEVIRHGILPFEISDAQYEAAKSALDQKYAALHGKTVFAALGFQNHYKGTDLLAHVWAETPELRHAKDAALLIAGKVNDPRLDLSVLQGVDNAIVECRRLSDEEYIYLLRHTCVYLLPYREISQSGALLTVLPEHIPVLVTDVGSLAEPLGIARIGWKIQHAEAHELQDALTYLLHHKEEIEAIRNDRQSWEKACHFYNWRDISCQTRRLYELLME